MKTQKTIFILSLAFILFVFGSNNIYARGKTQVSGIHYQVTLHGDPAQVYGRPVLVNISDENGNLVAHPQTFVKGVFTYNFTETGPVEGKRIAWLGLDPSNEQVPGSVPDVENGPFYAGVTYTFTLDVKQPDPTGAATVLP